MTSKKKVVVLNVTEFRSCRKSSCLYRKYLKLLTEEIARNKRIEPVPGTWERHRRQHQPVTSEKVRAKNFRAPHFSRDTVDLLLFPAKNVEYIAGVGVTSQTMAIYRIGWRCERDLCNNFFLR